MSVCSAASHTLRVAAVQVESHHGQIEANHAHATPFIEQAAREGAQVVVLPELFASGYLPSQAIWRHAEPRQGLTIAWLRDTARRLGIILGAGLAEIDGTDCYNAYALAGPGGEIVGWVRKEMAETYCFRQGRGRRVVSTGLGHLGVGICADNHYTAQFRRLQAEPADLVLMPHAGPTPSKADGLVSEEDLARRDDLGQIADLYARLMGVPVVFVNPVGPMAPMVGILGKLMPPTSFALRGGSRIVDGDGTVKGELGDAEGVLVADVSLDPVGKAQAEAPDHGGWMRPGSMLLRRGLIPIDAALGTLYYRLRRSQRIEALRRSPA